MSIAILPMSAEFNWNPATVGLIQSSFFWGYLLTQVGGEPLASSCNFEFELAYSENIFLLILLHCFMSLNLWLFIW